MRGATGIVTDGSSRNKFQSTRPMRGATFTMLISNRSTFHFNPRAPCGARRLAVDAFALRHAISIHAPHAGRDQRSGRRGAPLEISIHAPHAGRDSARAVGLPKKFIFQSTRPMRGATQSFHYSTSCIQFQSTRPMRGATTGCSNRGSAPCRISIHAPHAGRDMNGGKVGKRTMKVFQSTRPMRGATLSAVHDTMHESISIHAPHAGRDSKSIQNYFTHFCDKRQFLDNFTQNTAFQSVLPLADRQKLLYLRCEPLRRFLRAFASHYKIIGSSGR